MQFMLWAPLGESLNSALQWPITWATRALQCQAAALRQLAIVVQRPSPSTFDRLAVDMRHCCASATSAPFDMVRSGYAAGVQSGLFERSLLASAAFNRQVAAIEHVAYGPGAAAD